MATPSSPPQLCGRCAAIFQATSLELETPSRLHHRDIASFRSAVAAGCPMCNALLTEWEGEATPSDDETAPFHTIYCLFQDFLHENDALPNELQKLKKVLVINLVASDRRARQFIFLPSSDVEALSPLRITQPTDPGKARFETARYWLKNCHDNHLKCQALHAWKSSGRRYQPQRLVRIPEQGSTTWRLVLRGEYDTPGGQDYVTLSHRWAARPDQNTLLLDENVEAFRRGQDVALLPRTFQDALLVARELRVPYVWIDCLCIIQNSAADWDEQSREMGKIYTHSICNISATGVANNSESFLEQMGRVVPLPRVRPAWLNHDVADRRESTDEQPREEQDDWCVVDRFSWWAQVTKKTLMKRGWVFQERLLTQRVLHFGTDQVLWECATHDASEAFPYGLPSWLHTRGQTKFKDVTAFQSVLGQPYDSTSTAHAGSSAPPSSRGSDVFYSWCDIIESYSRTRLTKPTDKLVALAGIAEFASRWRWSDESQLPPQYLAGVFNHDLLLMLEWNTYASRRSGSREIRPTEFVAPSWSWASIEGRVYFDYHSRTFATWQSDGRIVPGWARRLWDRRRNKKLPLPMELLGWQPLVFHLQAQTKTSPEAPFGRVYDGHLDAEGWVLKLASLYSDHGAATEGDHYWSVLVYEDAPADVPKEDLFALPLRCIKLRNWAAKQSYWVTGLILRKTEAADQATYTRFGLFSIPSSEGTRGIGVKVTEDPFQATISNGQPLSAIRII